MKRDRGLEGGGRDQEVGNRKIRQTFVTASQGKQRKEVACEMSPDNECCFTVTEVSSVRCTRRG